MTEIARQSGGSDKMGPGTLYDNVDRLLERGFVEENDRRPVDDDPAAPLLPPDEAWQARPERRGRPAGQSSQGSANASGARERRSVMATRRYRYLVRVHPWPSASGSGRRCCASTMKQIAASGRRCFRTLSSRWRARGARSRYWIVCVAVLGAFLQLAMAGTAWLGGARHALTRFLPGTSSTKTRQSRFLSFCSTQDSSAPSCC